MLSKLRTLAYIATTIACLIIPATALAETELLELYEGDGLFQCGSLEGPQSIDIEYTEGVCSDAFLLGLDTVYAVSGSEASNESAASDGVLYSAILDAMNGRQIIDNAGKKAVRVDIHALNYQYNDDNKRDTYYVYTKVVNDHPSMFYYVPDVFYGRLENENIINSLYLLINYDIYNRSEDFEDEADRIVSEAVPDRSGMSETEIALALHDYLTLHVRYSYQAAEEAARNQDGVYDVFPNAFSAFGAIIDKQAVCHGLSLAYKELLSRLGIDAYVVPDYEAGHAWNLIKLDEKWYHADLTYAVGFGNGSANDADNDRNFLGCVRHERFLLSDIQQGELYPQDDWALSLPPAPTENQYRSFWQDVRSGMFYSSGYWYYNNGDYDAVQPRSNGDLQRSPFGRCKTPVTLQSRVSFPALIMGKVFYYDSNDNGLYAMDLLTGRSFRRRILVDSYIAEMGSGHIKPAEITVPYGNLYFVLANGAQWSMYAKNDLGDVNGDSFVDVMDILTILKNERTGSLPENETTRARSDTNWDQVIDSKDAERIAQIVTELAV